MRIVLLAASGRSHIKVARQLGVTIQTVGKWRRRFLSRRLDSKSNAMTREYVVAPEANGGRLYAIMIAQVARFL